MTRKFVTTALLAVLIAATPARAPAQNGDAAVVKQALDLLRAGDAPKAQALAGQMRDPAARALVQWAAIRLTPKDMGFEKINAFLRERPHWPHQSLMRRRAEKLLYDEKRDAAAVRAFFGREKPVSGEGKLALARALLSADKNAAHALVREAWQLDDLSKDTETETFKEFSSVLTRADHKARADRFFYQEKTEPALRAAERGGADLSAYGKARAAVIKRAGNAAKLLDAVPAALRTEAGYIFARIKLLRRKEDYAGAAKLLLAAPRDPKALIDTDEWWVQRRLIARKLLETGDARTAYRIVSQTAMPEKENPRVEHEFTAGWIALRFLKDPAAAARHFAAINKFSSHPTSLARGHYWHGRALEAAGDRVAALAEYDRAARHVYAYYGQIARSRMGTKELPVSAPPTPGAAARAEFERQEPVRALRLLYAAGETDLALSMLLDLTERARDVATATLLAEIPHQAQDARSLVFVAKAAFGRGLPIDTHAFPTFGMPAYKTAGPAIDNALVYSIARQESAFNPKAISPADARGLMQVVPSTGKAIAKKYGVAFDAKKLIGDPAFNVQIGAAELGDLLEVYRGSYILTFAAYNAGRSRVAEWIGRYGDPRDAQVDPIDWVERIPFSETRNYVQRIMENVQVYKARLGKNGAMIDADLARGRVN
jgi:soluble lytic murein transglycosylase